MPTLTLPTENLLLLSILIIAWWIGVWGLCEMGIDAMAGSNTTRRCIAYGSLVLFVLGYLAWNPQHIERFS